MITGQMKTEAQYRALVMNSSSSLKEFSLDRKKYYRKYILGENVEDKDSQAAIMGRVVETLLLEPELFDERFYMSACATSPTGNMLAFVEALYKHTAEAVDDDGNITKTFEEISKLAFSESGYSGKGTGSYETIINKFKGSDAEIYYNEIRKVKSNGLTVVTPNDVNNAEKIVEELKTNSATYKIVNLQDDDRYTIYNQLQIEGYVVDGMQIKSMIDKVVVDHEKKTIQEYDLKCTWSVEGFLEEYYLYRRAYIQALLYYKAAIHFMNNTEELRGYRVEPLKFIVCDSTNYYAPLVYALSDKDLENAYNGFTYKNREYKGVAKLIKELKWALENNTWNISMDNYLSGEEVKIM
jgi:hypothetical protein